MAANPDVKIIAEDLDTGDKICEFELAKRRNWTRFLSSVGELVFDIKYDDPKFKLISGIKTVLKVVRNGETVWAGNYDYVSANKQTLSIFASSFERLLDDYVVEPDNGSNSSVRAFSNKKLGNEIVQVLFNEAKNKSGSNLSGFTLGAIENPYDPGTTNEMTETMEFDYDTVYEAIESTALAGKADFLINPANKTFNFYRRRGEDEANVVFRLKNLEPSNISNFNRDLDFRKISNKIYAFGVGVRVNYLKATSSDGTSQSTYGLMERNLGIPKSLVDQGTLDKVTAEEIKRVKKPAEEFSPSLIVNDDGIGLFDGYTLGDNVRIILDYGSMSLDTFMRVIGIQVSYSDTGAENIYLYLREKED